MGARGRKEINIMFTAFSGKYLKEILKSFSLKGPHKMKT
jgi:hypothetical protein